MSRVLNGNGNGNSNGITLTSPPKSSEPPTKEARVFFKSADGIELRGVLGHMTHHSAMFELYGLTVVLHASESLTEFTITINGQTIYAGKAIIRTIVDAGPKAVCEVTLAEAHWSKTDSACLALGERQMAHEFKTFLQEWQASYTVSPEFKVVVADMQIFLQDLHLWLNQVEIKMHQVLIPENESFKKEVINNLAKPIAQSIDTFIDRFESIVAELPDENHPPYQAYLRRQLHPLILSSPFANRAFNKPLGYAGDYQMVDMMIRPPEEGDDLFSKIINIWLLGQIPARAHRNRVDYLRQKLIQEALRAKFNNRRLQVFNLGCGPAAEIQSFLETQTISNSVDFCLVDFNAETLDALSRKLNSQAALNRAVSFRTLKKSVTQILKDGGKSLSPHPGGKYGYIYCAGLFDYLSNAVCKQLMEVFYNMLEPGGLLVATNASDVMNDSKPFRFSMEYMLDWHLIYRNRKQFCDVLPDCITESETTITADETGANLFLEVRKNDNV